MMKSLSFGVILSEPVRIHQFQDFPDPRSKSFKEGLLLQEGRIGRKANGEVSLREFGCFLIEGEKGE